MLGVGWCEASDLRSRDVGGVHDEGRPGSGSSSGSVGIVTTIGLLLFAATTAPANATATEHAQEIGGVEKAPAADGDSGPTLDRPTSRLERGDHDWIDVHKVSRLTARQIDGEVAHAGAGAGASAGVGAGAGGRRGRRGGAVESVDAHRDRHRARLTSRAWRRDAESLVRGDEGGVDWRAQRTEHA